MKKKPSKFKFKGFRERLSEIKIDVVHKISRSQDIPSEDHDTFFRESLEKWRELNCTENFALFDQEVRSKIGSLNQLVFNKEFVVQALLKHLQVSNSLALDALIDLVVQLARDLQYEFSPYFSDFFKIFLVFVNSSDPDLIERTFIAIAYLFKYSWRNMIKEYHIIYGLYKDLLSSSRKPHVKQFAAESFSFLIRRVKDHKALFTLMLTDLSTDTTAGVAHLVFETIKGVKRHMHSCGQDILQLMLFYLMSGSKLDIQPELILAVMETLTELMLKSLNMESVNTLWNLLLDELRAVINGFDQGSSNLEISKQTDHLLQLMKCVVANQSGYVIPDNQICQMLLCLSRKQDTFPVTKDFIQLVVVVFEIADEEDKNALVKTIFSSGVELNLLRMFIRDSCELESFKDLILPELVSFISMKINACDVGDIQNVAEPMKLLSSYVHHELKRINDDNIVNIGLDFSSKGFCEKLCRCISIHGNQLEFCHNLLLDVIFTLHFVRPVDGPLVCDTFTHYFKFLCNFFSPMNSEKQKFLVIFSATLKTWVSIAAETGLSVSKAIAHSDLILMLKGYGDSKSLLDAYLQYCTYLSRSSQSSLSHSELEEIYPSLSDNLVSPSPRKSLLTLEIIKCYWNSETVEDPSINQMLMTCLNAGRISPSFHAYQERLLHLRKLSYKKTELRELGYFLREVPLLYLTGNLFINLSLLWEPVMEVISSYFVQESGISFWDTWSRILLFASNCCQQMQIPDECDVDVLFTSNVTRTTENQKPDYMNFRILLWRTMCKFTSIAERKSRDFVPLFLDFIRDELHKANTSAAATQNIASRSKCKSLSDETMEGANEDDDEEDTKEQSGPTFSFHGSSVKRLQTLCEGLRLLATFKNPKAIFKEPMLFSLYNEFLSHKDNEVQKCAFACLVSYRLPYIRPYEDHFNRLFDDKTFRDELTLLITDEENSIVDKEHRIKLIPVIIRILVGKLYRRSGLGASGKTSQSARRNIIMQFLSLCSTEEMETFIDIICSPFMSLTGNTGVDMEHVVPLKKQQGFLQMLAHLFTRLKMGILPFLPRIAKIVLALVRDANNCLSRREEMATCFVHQVKVIRQYGIARLTTLYDSYHANDLSSFMTDIFDAVVWPQLETICQESYNHPTPLLKLILTWAKHARYHPLLTVTHATTHMSPIASVLAILGHANVSDEVASSILVFIENVMVSKAQTTENEVKGRRETLETRTTAKHYPGAELIKPYIGVILKYLTESIIIQRRKSKWKSTQNRPACSLRLHFSVLSKISHLVEEEEDCQAIIKLLLPFAKHSPSEDIATDTLTTVRNLLRLNLNVECILSDISRLFTSVAYRSARVILCEIFDTISETVGEWSIIRDVIADINAWDVKRLDEPDYERRLKGYRTLGMVMKQGHLSEQQLLPVVNNCVYFVLETDDLSLRDAASNALSLILENMAQREESYFDQLLYSTVIPAVKLGLKSKKEATRQSFIQILSQIIKLFSSPSFKDLKCLTNDDLEVDFFQNVKHIQAHRRIRAIHQFTQICNNGALSVASVYDFILPIISHFVFDKMSVKDHNLVSEATQALGAIASFLPWSKYSHVLRNYLKVLIRKEDNQKVISRVLVSWLDAFHFDMSSLPQSDKAGDMKYHSRNKSATESSADEVEPQDDSDDEEHEEDLEQETVNSFTADSVELAQRILQTVVNKILPPLHKFLTKKLEAEDQLKQLQDKSADQAEILRIPLALTIVKLLQKLPKYLLQLQLPGIVLKVCNSLKSRARDVRDVARDTLVKITVALGPEYFDTILKEMYGILKRGYQRHVLSFTVHKMLERLSSVVKPGDLDKSLKILVEILTDDVFGESAEEKEVQKIVDKLYEAKSVKSYDSFEILGKLVSRGLAMEIIKPVRLLLEESQSQKVAHKAEEVLRKVGLGLQANVSVADSDLLIFMFNVANDNVTIQNGSKTGSETDAQERSISKEPGNIFLIPENPGRSGVAPEASKKTNVHVLVEFALQLLCTCLKRQRLLKTNEEHLRMLDPFVPLACTCLGSKHVKVLVLAMRALSHLVKFPLPSVTTNMPSLTKAMFKILKSYSRTGAGKGDNYDLVMTSFKAMTVLIRDYQSQKISKKQLQVLLTFVEEDIYDDSKQATAFPMLKAILSRKLEIPAIHEVMNKVNKLLVVSTSPITRQSCRQLALQYMLDYPLGKKVETMLRFFVSNLSYEEEFGRESTLEFLASVFNGFPSALVQKFSGFFFVPLVMHLVNEESSSCKKLAYHTIKLLLEKVDVERRDYLFSLSSQWREEEKVVLKQMACQVTGVFVEAEGKSFERRLPVVIPFIRITVDADCYHEEQEVSLDDGQLSAKDQLLFVALGCLNKICHHCNVIRNSNYTEDMTAIWGSIQKHTLHAHTWVRLLASQLIGHLFAAWDIRELVATISSTQEHSEFMSRNLIQKVRELSLDFCDQLKADSLPEELASQTIKNLIYLGRVINRLVESSADEREGYPMSTETANNGVTDDRMVEKWLNVSWLMKKMCGFAKHEASYAPHEHTKRMAVFRWIGAIAMDLGKERLKPCLVLLLRPVHRELNNSLLPPDSELRLLAQEVLDLLREIVGVDDFVEGYAKLQRKVSGQKEAKKRTLAAEAVINPSKMARRKLKLNLAKREQKKRKLLEKKPLLRVKKFRHDKTST